MSNFTLLWLGFVVLLGLKHFRMNWPVNALHQLTLQLLESNNFLNLFLVKFDQGLFSRREIRVILVAVRRLILSKIFRFFVLLYGWSLMAAILLFN